MQHVINDLTMLMLRTEQNDLGVLTDLDRVPRWPVEQVSTTNDFVRTICIGDCEFALQYISPVRSLAEITLHSLKQRSDIRAGAERKVLAAYLSIACRIAKVGVLPDPADVGLQSLRELVGA